MADALRADFPEVVSSCLLGYQHSGILQFGKTTIEVEKVTTANHGRTNHPAIMIVDSDEELVNKVASIPGAVGVVDVYAINSSVSVIKLAGKLPLEPGYLLHGN